MRIDIPVDEQKHITLTLTNSCNLNCRYCYEHSKSSDGMTLELAKKIIQEELNADNVFKHVDIDLFGGEPFIRFDLIKQITEFLQENNFKKTFSINITTNGTLVHGEIQEWLKLHKDIVTCGLSWDGTPEMQNANRSNSANMVDLSFFAETYPDAFIKMTISPLSLPSLADGVIFCHSKGFKVFCNLAYGENWSDLNYDKILETQLQKLMEFYIENPEVPPCSMLGDKFSQIAANKDSSTIKSWCSAGTHTTAYDVLGNKYPCQFFMPLSNSSADNKPVEIEFLRDVPLDKLEGECKTCVIRSACPTCYGYNYYTTGNMYKRDINICRLTKIILKARSYFLTKLWQQHRWHFDENEEQAMLRSILIIQTELK